MTKMDITLKDTTLSHNFDYVNEKLISVQGPAFKAYREKWLQSYKCDEPVDFPIHIDFETVYGCNLKCKMCHLNMNNKNAATFMDFKQKLDINIFRKVIDEGVDNGLCAVTVNNIGEPLLRDDIFDFINYASRKGILDIWMSTNGTLLTGEKSELIITSGLTRINISLDAYTPETYEKVRGRNMLNKIKENIFGLLEARKKYNSELPIVKVSFCLLNINEHEVEDFTEYWSKHVDSVGIQQYWEANEEEKLKSNKRLVQRFVCREPWHRIAVNANGSVSPCCLPWREGFTMGDVSKQSMKEIWNSEKMQRLRRNLLENKFDNEFDKCQICMEQKF